MFNFKNRSFLVKLVNDKDAPETEPVEETIDLVKIKNHFKRNVPSYIIGIAGITYVIMKGRYETLATGGVYGPETADTLVTMRPLTFFSSRTENVVKVVNRSGHGRPGYLIHSLDTNEFFSSQREAARIFDISEKLLSNHLNGKLPNVEGYKFERLNFAE